MVRVGGGWEALDEFLVKNDPCRGEGMVSGCITASPPVSQSHSFTASLAGYRGNEWYYVPRGVARTVL